MLDSYKDQTETFNSSTFVRELCYDTKIQLYARSKIHFLVGWKSLVENLIKILSAYPILINEITDCYSVLDVKFEILKRTKEVEIWREIDRARNNSSRICACCGEEKGHQKHSSVSMFCDRCIKNEGIYEKTGTWLDSY